MTTLSIANSYGNVDVRNPLSKAYKHIKGQRLQPLCRKLGIKYAEALVDFEQDGSYCHPVLDGVVVSARSAPRLLGAIAARNERTNSPAAIARKERIRRCKAAKEKRRAKKYRKLGIDPDGHTARWLNEGQVDEDFAELIGFKTKYRHEHSDYDQRFDAVEFHDLRSLGYSPQEAREEMQSNARMEKHEDPIPATWPEYLEEYGFVSPAAKALAGVLKSSSNCHPIWFKEAEIAVRRAALPLNELSYEAVRLLPLRISATCGEDFRFRRQPQVRANSGGRVGLPG